jgi:DNA (cytosine-5)-methyltransferase 1
MKAPISIIDIFAGPGGLGEGFSALRSKSGSPIFKIKLSIEKDEFAHSTLELRAFFRQFCHDKVPENYYRYLRGDLSRCELFEMYPKEAEKAKSEAWLAELGKTDRLLVKTRIETALDGEKNWVLIGGPPCQAYSLAGRSRMIGKDRQKYERDERHFLYKEYLRILANHQPSVFVMENVKGLLSAQLQQHKTFELILNDLRNPLDAIESNSKRPLHYRLFSISKKRIENTPEIEPSDFIVRCEDYGIPQARHRIIIVGIRSDIYKSDPETLNIVSKRVTIEDVIGDLPRLRSGLSRENDSADEWLSTIKSIEEANWLTSTDASLQQALHGAARKVGTRLGRGGRFVRFIPAPRVYENWYVDNTLAGVCNHETRSHIRSDLHRYFFAAVFAFKYGKSPTLGDFPSELLPDHDNVKEALRGSKFNDRFRVQICGRPSTTVVSHISKDGHYYIHYDPSQCRSLTVREAARLQTFPDNYFFEGNRTQQYHQVGNAVPPLLANKIASIIFKVLNE